MPELFDLSDAGRGVARYRGVGKETMGKRSRPSGRPCPLRCRRRECSWATLSAGGFDVPCGIFTVATLADMRFLRAPWCARCFARAAHETRVPMAVCDTFASAAPFNSLRMAPCAGFAKRLAPKCSSMAPNDAFATCEALRMPSGGIRRRFCKRFRRGSFAKTILDAIFHPVSRDCFAKAVLPAIWKRVSRAAFAKPSHDAVQRYGVARYGIMHEKRSPIAARETVAYCRRGGLRTPIANVGITASSFLELATGLVIRPLPGSGLVAKGNALLLP